MSLRHGHIGERDAESRNFIFCDDIHFAGHWHNWLAAANVGSVAQQIEQADESL